MQPLSMNKAERLRANHAYFRLDVKNEPNQGVGVKSTEVEHDAPRLDATAALRGAMVNVALTEEAKNVSFAVVKREISEVEFATIMAACALVSKTGALKIHAKMADA